MEITPLFFLPICYLLGPQKTSSGDVTLHLTSIEIKRCYDDVLKRLRGRWQGGAESRCRNEKRVHKEGWFMEDPYLLPGSAGP